jgi:hypothetical protein
MKYVVVCFTLWFIATNVFGLGEGGDFKNYY